MAISNILVNKAKASKLYIKESLFDLDLNNSRGEGFNIYNTAFKPTTIAVYIFSAPFAYTKV
jgi:hypothetical protein